MVKIKKYLTLLFTFMTFKMNFNSAVSLFVLIKNVLVPRTSHVKGYMSELKFLPVPDHPA